MDAVKFEMKKLLISSMDVCDKKCLPATPDRNFVNSFEKTCLSKCFDQNIELWQKSLHKVNGAFHQHEEKTQFD